MKDTLILKDGTIIELEAAGSMGRLVSCFTDWDTAIVTLKKLTKDNLSVAQVKNGAGLVVGNYTDLILKPGEWKMGPDGVWITISLREKTEEERRLDALEAGQEIQDGAIIDLAGIVGGEA